MSADDVLHQISLIASRSDPNANVSDRLRALQLVGKYHARLDQVSVCH